MILGKNYIGDKLGAQGNVVLKTIDPKLNIENSISFIEATISEVDEAVQLASKAFKEYRKVSGEKRAIFLNAIADEILALDQELIDVYTLESGLSEGIAIGERGRTVFQLLSFAELVSNEDFELVPVSGMGHSAGGNYGKRKRKDFFVKHLLKVTHPSWG
tara:strand:+ start:98579 stop:99058 length:480 start_codon:yes stop_codon:yes gene_type:complete